MVEYDVEVSEGWYCPDCDRGNLLIDPYGGLHECIYCGLLVNVVIS